MVYLTLRHAKIIIQSNKDMSKQETWTQPQITECYGIPRHMIKKYFPRGTNRHIRTRKGQHYTLYVWTNGQLQHALKHPEIVKFLQAQAQKKKDEQDIFQIQQIYNDYSPDYYIDKAKEKNRSFVLHVGPTNSGKTYDAIEDMKANTPGTYLGPLRLLALEMYDKVNASGIPCSMITGEESLITEDAEIISSTIELCDTKKHFKTAVIDEAQLIADPFRGAAWLKAICLVDADVVHICMAPEALDYIEKLIKSFGAFYSVVRHERLAPLTYAGSINGYEDLKEGDALICFSRKSVLSTAALLEKNGFKASVIYGALPPESRRNEVRKYLEGETTVVVATDAIGMGISLPIKRVIFTETEKYDGKRFRTLSTAEIKQIGGRAGRYGLNEYGEVLVLGEDPIIERRLDGTVRDIEAACISFPRSILQSDYPLRLLLEAWQRMPRSKDFVRENMFDAQFLLKKLSQIKIKPPRKKKGQSADKAPAPQIDINKLLEENRELVYDLITCPVDVKSDELVEYYVRCSEAILRGRYIPLPDFGTDTLMNCELEYKGYDVRHQLLRRIGLPDEYSHVRQTICEKISEFMKEDKDQYIRRCRYCGKELPIGSIYNFCDECYYYRDL